MYDVFETLVYMFEYTCNGQTEHPVCIGYGVGVVTFDDDNVQVVVAGS